MTIIPSHGVTKSAMRKKVEEKLLKVAGISRLEETHMTELKDKWLVVTNKECKTQVKREAERILKGVTLQIMNPTYSQPGNIAKEHRNPILVTYAAALQIAAENGPEITNVATPLQSKRNCIVLFNALDTELYPRQPQMKQNNNKDDKENNSLLNETTTTWRDELKDTLTETTKLLEEKIDAKAKKLEAHLNNNLNATLKELQSALICEVATMILTQREKEMEKINISIVKAISNAINAGQNQHYITPTDNYPELTPENQLIANNITP